METTLWIVIVFGIGFWLSSWLVCVRLRVIPRSPANESVERRVSVVVPARNEEDNIGALLRTLPPDLHGLHEVIVVDDQSDDQTAERARAGGAMVLPGEALPDGWLGKPWACQQGAERASGEWLLFLDADTRFEPGGFARLIALARDAGEVHSVCPWHRVEAPYEQWSSFFNVTMILGMNAFTVRGPRAREIGLFGQVLLISRRQYEAVGGHRPVKGQVLENFHLAGHLRAHGATCHCWLGKGVVRMRMFATGMRSLVEGWSKGFVSGASNTARGAMVGISLWFSGLFMAAGSLAGSLAVEGPFRMVALAFYLACVGQVAYLFRAAGSFWFVNALCYPVTLVFYQVVFLRAVRRRKRGGSVQWKGRDVG